MIKFGFLKKALSSRISMLCVCFITLVSFNAEGFSQARVITAGFQFKPIFPSSMFGTANMADVVQNNIGFRADQKNGSSLGMIIRFGINKRFSFETGIHYVKRNFDLIIRDTTFYGKSDFKIIGYEIPVQGMIFLQMSKRVYMGASGGLSLDMYPSNIRTTDTYFIHNSKRNGVFQFGILANLGWELRTEKSGIIYLGASYHLPFSNFYTSTVKYVPSQEIIRFNLKGNYLTLDFRYYFHEDPAKQAKKKAKS